MVTAVIGPATASVFAIAAGLADPLVLLLFGEARAEVAPIFAVLAVGGIFRSIQQIAWTYLAKGKSVAQFRMIMVSRPLMIVIIVAGVLRVDAQRDPPGAGRSGSRAGLVAWAVTWIALPPWLSLCAGLAAAGLSICIDCLDCAWCPK